MEALPLLKRASQTLALMKEDLRKAAAIKVEARANGGAVMTEAFDQSPIDYFIPTLSFDKALGTWALKR